MDYKNMLRKSGFKATPARIEILQFLQKSRTPASAQTIIDSLSDRIDQVTVYRTLKSLKEKGILRQVDLRHNHAHYEIADPNEEHHHLICLHCGRIEDVKHDDSEYLEKSILRNSKHFAKIQQHALEFYGTCTACEKKEAQSS